MDPMDTTNRRTEQGLSREAYEHSEGRVARTIEGQTARLPSDVWLWAAIAAMGVSFTLMLAGRKHESLFVGQWPAPFLLFGTYNKLVKQRGSDRLERQPQHH